MHMYVYIIRDFLHAIECFHSLFMRCLPLRHTTVLYEVNKIRNKIFGIFPCYGRAVNPFSHATEQ